MMTSEMFKSIVHIAETMGLTPEQREIRINKIVSEIFEKFPPVQVNWIYAKVTKDIRKMWLGNSSNSERIINTFFANWINWK